MKRRSSVVVVVLTLVLGFGCFSLAAGPNILTMSCNQEFGTIDPQRGNDWTESMAMVNVYD
ncbi:ABC transporter substrate-binding protein, partial [Candidatus Bipolaricaulota bacterium]|nr:ABC transporter substrate-binding protein [Candidatus Bipolaricaulota bacterium]